MSFNPRENWWTALIEQCAREKRNAFSIIVESQNPNNNTGSGGKTCMPDLIEARSPVTASKPSSSRIIDETSRSHPPTCRPKIIVRLPNMVPHARSGAQPAPLTPQSLVSDERYPSHVSDTTDGIAAVTPPESTTGFAAQNMPEIQQPYDDPVEESNNVGDNDSTFVDEHNVNASRKSFDNEMAIKRIEDMLSATAEARIAMGAMESVLETKRELLQYGSEGLSAVKMLDVAMDLSRKIKATLPMVSQLVKEMEEQSWDDDAKDALADILEHLGMDASKLHLLNK